MCQFKGHYFNYIIHDDQFNTYDICINYSYIYIYRDLCKLKLLCLAHKAIYTGEPKYLAELLSIAISNRPRRD